MNKSNEYFDIIAHAYDQATSEPGAWTPPDIVYENIKQYLSEESNVLDIGVGTGLSIDKVYKNTIFNLIVGVDVSKKMIELCSDKYPKATLLQIKSLSEISSFDINFGVVICSGTLEFIDDIDALFCHVRKVQQPNDIFAFTYEPIVAFHIFQKDSKSLTVPNKESSLYIEDFYTYRYHSHDINRILKENGYSVIKDVEFVSYKKGEHNIIYHAVVASAL